MSLQPEPGARGQPRGHGGRPPRPETAPLSGPPPRVAALVVLHELGQAAGVERVARHLETRIANGEIRAIDARFAAEQFILMVVTGPRRRALGLGTPLSPAGLSEWIDQTVTLFLQGCGGR